MTARDEAIEAAARAIFAEAGPECIDDDGADTFAQVALAAAVPVLLNDLADRIDKLGSHDDVTLLAAKPGMAAWASGVRASLAASVNLVRHAAEGWGAD